MLKSGLNAISAWGLGTADGAVNLFPIACPDPVHGFYCNNDKLHSE